MAAIYLKMALFFFFTFLFFASTGLWHWAWFGKGRGRSGQLLLRLFPFLSRRFDEDDAAAANHVVEAASTWMMVFSISCLGVVTYLMIMG